MPRNLFEDVYNQIQDSVYNDSSPIEKMTDDLPGIYVFISIDLVNSTILKTRYTSYWPFVIQSFYEIVTSALGAEFTYRGTSPIRYVGKKEDFENEKMKTGGVKVWKLVGDEVLLYHKIVSVSELLNIIRIMDWVTVNIIDLFVSKGESYFSDNLGYKTEFVRIARQHLAAKTTMWVAQCGKRITLDCPNMYYDASNYMESTSAYLDFLGPDIDAGFRLCKFAEKNKVIISPELIVLLTVQMDATEGTELISEIENNFRIVAYEAMEDIWDERLYPIFMYCSGKKKSGEKEILRWRRMFEYDEKETSKLTKYIFNDALDFAGDEYNYKQLDPIYKALGRSEEITEVKKNFQDQIRSLNKIKNVIVQKNKKFEFHISCVCYEKNSNKIWIDRHKNHGLSFGCIKIAKNHEYFEEVKQGYKNKYKIDISFSDNSEFISFYSVNRKGGKEEVLGIIFLVMASPEIGGSLTQKFGWYSFDAVKKITKRKGVKKINEFDYVIDKVESKTRNSGA